MPLSDQRWNSHYRHREQRNSIQFNYFVAFAYTDKCPRAPAMWCYCSAVSFLNSCVLHVMSKKIGSNFAFHDDLSSKCDRASPPRPLQRSLPHQPPPALSVCHRLFKADQTDSVGWGWWENDRWSGRDFRHKRSSTIDLLRRGSRLPSD